MALTLTPDALRAAYEFLCETPPFNRWNLPSGEDVKFRVADSKQHFGWHTFDGQRHEIAVSRALVGQTVTLIETLAHEMIHVHERHTGTCKPGVEHSAAFNRWAAQVCRAHGFDPKAF